MDKTSTDFLRSWVFNQFMEEDEGEEDKDSRKTGEKGERLFERRGGKRMSGIKNITGISLSQN